MNEPPPPRPPPNPTRSPENGSASDVVRGAITRYGSSRAELSRRSGVDAAIISRFMRKQATITLVTFELLAIELGIWVGAEHLN